jgi:HD-GYP domain-containing protein (c-di-GMP phosphodiesterase class II)
MKDTQREIWAIGNFGALCAGMGQWNAAILYLEKARELAEEHGFADLEFHSRTNLADCAVQLREPAAGLRVLSQFRVETPQTRPQMSVSASGRNTLARLHLLVGDLDTARIHAEESARLARMARLEKITPNSEATLALIDVCSGAVEKGLSVLERSLTFARQKSQVELPDYLGMCIDAYEAVGRSDKALEYLQELVEWKKKSIEAAVTPLQYEGLVEPIRFETGASFSEDGLLARAHLLQTGVLDRIEYFVETAINADLVSGHDLYRTFRIAKLARYLGAAIGWEQRRLDPLALGAQLCNIGMIAIPARILQKPRGLSDGERHVLRDHTRYGAELLRKSKLKALEGAAAIAEQHHERYDGSGYPLGLSGEATVREDSSRSSRLP